MNDFLTRMVRRSFNPTPTVQPRVASTFESISPPLDVVRELDLPLEPVLPANSPTQYRSAASRSPSQATVLEDTPTPSSNSQMKRLGSLAMIPETASTLPATNPVSLEQIRPRLAEITPQSQVPVPSYSPGQLRQFPPRAGQDQADGSPFSEPRSPTQRSVPASPPVDSGDYPLVSLNQAPLTTAKSKMANPLLGSTPSVSSALRVPELSALKAAASEAPPTIQVSIGRIEVRAISQPASPTPPSRRAPPPLTLDQYLHQRSGG